MKNASLLLLVFFFLLIYSCKKTDALAGSNPDEGSSVTYNINKANLLSLVNNIRKQGCTCGSTMMPPVAAVLWNDQLGKISYDHSKDMKQSNYFSHTALNGSTPGDRISSGGYNWLTYGENIALGYSTEQAVMDGWLNSEGHCKNIMNAAFKELGAGKEGNYWTQIFATK